MRLKELIAMAIAQGHIIEYVERKDGGLRVTKVNGKAFRKDSSAGNAAVRQITGAKLSVKQTKALKKNRKKTLSSLVGSKTKKRIKKLNEARKKVGLEAIPTRAVGHVKKRSGQRGVKQLIERGKRALRYKKDYAYNRNVMGFVSQLMDAADIPNRIGETYDFGTLIRLIQLNENYISETSLQYGILVMYDWLDGKIDGEYAESIMLVEFQTAIRKLRELEEEIEDI